MGKPIDLTGQRFGRLVARQRLDLVRPGQGHRWLCECDCGEMSTPRVKDLVTGNTGSCGCQRGRKGVTPRQLVILGAIAAAGGALWQAGLEHLIGTSTAQVARVTAALERGGLVKKLRLLAQSRWIVRLVLLAAGRSHLVGRRGAPPLAPALAPAL